MLSSLNYRVFDYINHLAGISPVVDKVGIVLASYMPLVFILWVAYLWFSGGKEKRNIALFLVYAAVLGLLVNYAITKVYFHPRPFMLHMGRLLIPHSPETSFPSDHATFMLSIAVTALCFRKTRTAGVALVVLGIVGGLARVFCGLHFPLDIAGSFGVALLSSIFICLVKDWLSRLNGNLLDAYDSALSRLRHESVK